MKPFIVAAAAFALIAMPHLAAAHDHGAKHGAGHSHSTQSYSAGQPGDPKKAARIVMVTMRETPDGKMIYEPSALEVKKGEQIRFVLTNAGDLEHD